jgi:hypothetical protein
MKRLLITGVAVVASVTLAACGGSSGGGSSSGSGSDSNAMTVSAKQIGGAGNVLDGFSDAFGGRQFTWHVVHGDNSSRSSAANAPPGTSPLTPRMLMQKTRG